jgi:hypothetical protein
MASKALSRWIWIAIGVMAFCTLGYVVLVWRMANGI